MKTNKQILNKLNETSSKLVQAIKDKKENTLIDERQKEDNINYYETQLNTLLFCLDLEDLRSYITSLQLNLK